MSVFGIALGGGGAKGAYHIGVWKALKELEIPISMVTGTSVGALNGALMVQDDFETAFKLWTEISVDKVIDFNTVSDQQKCEEFNSYSIIRSIIRAACLGRLDITPLKNIVNIIIDEKKIRQSSVNLGIVTFSLSDFKPVSLFKKDIPEGLLADYLLASSCFPTFQNHEINGKSFIDGGVIDNLPVSLLLDKNINDIIVVDITRLGIKKKVDTSGCNVINIKNSQNLGSVLDFNGERSKTNIEIGYNDTLKTFGKLKGKIYYVMPDSDYNKNKNKYINSLTPDDFKKLYHYLGLDWSDKPVPINNIIIYKIMNSISKYSDGKLNTDTVLPAMAEITAEQLGIKRIRSYTLTELIDEILREYNSIINSKDFLDYAKKLDITIISDDQEHYEKNFKETLTNIKFLIFYNPDFEQIDNKSKMFRRFIAMTFPKISIANMFIALLISKQDKQGK